MTLGSAPSNVADILGVHARHRPQAPALVDRGRTFGYAELDRAVWRAAAALRRRGLAPGDVVGVTLPDNALHMVLGYALARMGAIQLPLSRREPAAARAALAARYEAVGVIDERSADPAWLEDRGEAIDPAVRAHGGDAGWKISLSSGTGGAPKAVLQTHAMHLAWRPVYQAAVPVRADDRYLALIGLDFYSGFRQCTDIHWNGGATVLCDWPPSVPAVLELIEREGITYTLLTAFHLSEILGGLKGETPRFPRLTLRSGAMISTHALRQEIVRRLTPKLFICYGTNDVGTPFTVAHGEALERFPGSIGFPAPGVELRVTDAAGRDLPPGETGEICVRTPGMPAGYLDDAEATARAFRGGWHYPGDLGALSPEGALYFKGRADDMINYGGLKLYPAEIEAVLLAHPAVAEAAAVGLRTERHQELPAAAVVLRSPATDAELLVWCQRRLGRRCPRFIALLEAMPRSPLGKVPKSELYALVHAGWQRAKAARAKRGAAAKAKRS